MSVLCFIFMVICIFAALIIIAAILIKRLAEGINCRHRICRPKVVIYRRSDKECCQKDGHRKK